MKNVRQAIDELTALEPIKVWSLIVTLLGDLNRLGQTQISGKDINRLLSNIGIRENSIRVALHRLKKEGWIKAVKDVSDGRAVLYQLSSEGLKQTAAVYDDVYRKGVKFGDGWNLQIQDTGEKLTQSSSLELFNQVTLVPVAYSTIPSNAMLLPINREDVPAWMLELVISQKLLDKADKYLAILKQAALVTSKSGGLDDATLRLLVLHHWRKMALRDSSWFHMWLEPQGVMAQCHQQVCALLQEATAFNL